MSKILLLTGSLRPYNIPYLILTDLNIRINHYISAIRYYLYSSSFNKIVFVDNTGDSTDLDFLINEASSNNKELEVLSFTGNKYRVEHQGKGFGECENIEYSLKESNLIESDDLVVKITGRYEVLNINLIYEKINQNLPSFNRIPGNDMIDAFVFSFSPSTWNTYFKNAKEMIDDRNGYYFEHVIFDLIKLNKIRTSRLPYFPSFKQISGTSGVIDDRTQSIYRFLIFAEVISINSWQSKVFTLLFKIISFTKGVIRFLLSKFRLK